MTNTRIRELIDEALRPGQFFVGAGRTIRIEHHARDVCRWELFHGVLLDEAHTRLERQFESWRVVLTMGGAETGPALISVKLDVPSGLIHVVRHIEIYCESEPGPAAAEPVGEPATRWQTERVCTIQLKQVQDESDLSGQLAAGLRLAVIGTSRLAVTSIESPLPAFSLGQLAYFPDQPDGGIDRPMAGWRELIEAGLTITLTPAQGARILETVLRCADDRDVGAATRLFFERWKTFGDVEAGPAPLFRHLFNHLVLCGNTPFSDRLAASLRELADPDLWGPDSILDVISTMLRQLARHLTAYDLVRFHNGGANYPDALMLDALMRCYLELAERQAHAFKPILSSDRSEPIGAVVRRRAIRQAWLVRCQYEGHLVPDAPTSTGDNGRVLPSSHIRVPPVQITQPKARRRMLYAQQKTDDLLTTTTRTILNRAMDDLDRDRELIELGMAVFLDRPLGVFKEPDEPDRTPLLSYEAFSKRVAHRRIEQWRRGGCITDTRSARWRRVLDQCAPREGVAVADLTGHSRPGTLALEDARRAAMDFIFLRTTRCSLDDLLGRYDLEPLQTTAPDVWHWLRTSRHVLLIRTPRRTDRDPLLTGYDRNMLPMIHLTVRPPRTGEVRYIEFDGQEHPEAGLHVSLPETNRLGASRDSAAREMTCTLL